MMKTLFITVGISGSGKTELSKRIKAALDVDYHSSDDIRGEICNGDQTDQSKNGLVFKILHERIADSLSRGRSVISDTTALTKQTRKEFCKLALKYGAQTVALVMTTQINEAIESNNKRDRKVPEDIIHKQFGKFVVPDTTEINEIVYINWREDLIMVDTHHQSIGFKHFTFEEFIQRYAN